jgi:hypothetical protein
MKLTVWRRKLGASIEDVPHEPEAPKHWAFDRLGVVEAEGPDNLHPHTHVEGHISGFGVGMILVDETEQAWVLTARNGARRVAWDETPPSEAQLRTIEDADARQAEYNERSRRERLARLSRGKTQWPTALSPEQRQVVQEIVDWLLETPPLRPGRCECGEREMHPFEFEDGDCNPVTDRRLVAGAIEWRFLSPKEVTP